MTLIEVICALAILGTILVGVVLAKARHTHQLALAQQQQRAVRIADELIADWWAADRAVPINQAGRTDSQPSLAWSTRRVPNTEIERLGARVVRVEIHETRVNDTASQSMDAPLVTVDLVLPPPKLSGDADQQTAAPRRATPQRGARR